MIEIAIVVGSTRPGRKADTVAQWVLDIAKRRENARFTIVDIARFDLPFFDEPAPPVADHYTKEHTFRWAAEVARYDGYIFVTPEYSHSTSAVLKNALDFVYKEWNNKAAGFVGYGGSGGTRAVEQLRLILAELQVATVRNQVALSLYADFENFEKFTPGEHQTRTVDAMLDHLLPWARAMKSLRENR